MRKNVFHGPKRKVSSVEILEKIKKGEISLDAAAISKDYIASNSIVIYEDVMSANGTADLAT